MQKVVRIDEYCCRETVAALQHLLRLAERGRVRGLACCAKRPSGKEHILFTGDYKTDPAHAVAASMRMSWRLTQMADERDDGLEDDTAA